MKRMAESIAQRLSDFECACRKAGLRLTNQRLEIYRELVLSSDHPSAEVLHKRLRKRFPAISLDTIYRALATFVNHGLINKVETVESQGRFEAVFMRHHHLVCSMWQEIIDFKWDTIDKGALPEEIRAWGRIDNKNVVVYGVCKKCLQPC